MSNKFVMPVAGKYNITSPFGWRKDPITKKNKKHHNGADIVTGKKDEPILAAMNGRVLKATKSTASGGGFGWYVVLRHYIDGKFYTSLYAHMKEGSLKVRPGQLVKAGQQIGIMGTSGYSTGVHLHFEIWNGRTHGWSADGKGFAEPISFIDAMAKAHAVKQNVNASSPVPKKINPVPKHNISTTTKSSGSSGSSEKFHVVKAGDTLTKIAKQYGTTWQQLKKINNIKNANLIKAGQLIKLP